jgi:sugar transferase (PEP-CTERM system associated)
VRDSDVQVFNRHVSARSLTVFGFETVLISGSLFVAAQIHGSLGDAKSALWKIAVATAMYTLCFYYNDLYDLNVVHAKRQLAERMLQAAGTTAVALAAALFLIPSFALGHGTFTTSLCLLLLALPLWRIGFDRLARDSNLEERVVILGTGAAAQTVAREIAAQHDFSYRVVGVIEDAAAADIRRLVSDLHATRIVVSMDDRRGALPVQDLLEAKLSGVHVEDAGTTYERITGKLLIESIKPSWLIFSDGFRASAATRAVKRAADFTLAGVGIVLAAPLMALTALAVRLESPGPVLYRQERVGANGRVFTLSKFRSMCADAEGGTPVWATDKDDRVTRVGRFIRLTRLDELPQLWNVLRGDMSLVGPRPERPYFVEKLAAQIPFYTERHAVKPGVTGWAQVKYRYGSTVEDAMEKLRYDLYYIKHQSLAFDLTIVIDTVKVILARKGAQ